MGVKVPFAIVVSLIALNTVAAQDWPQFHGPRRDNRSDETGLLKQWPEGGPELLWKTQKLFQVVKLAFRQTGTFDYGYEEDGCLGDTRGQLDVGY